MKSVCCADTNERVLVMYSGNVQQRANFVLQHFEAMSSFGNALFILGNKLWEEHFESLLDLVEEYVLDLGYMARMHVHNNPLL